MNILVVGKPGSGKTRAVDAFKHWLLDFSYRPDISSDRIWLERAVLRDIEGTVPNEAGHREGPNAILLLDTGIEGTRQFRAKNGVLLNTAHDTMIRDLRRVRDHRVVPLMEYAIGPDLDGVGGGIQLLQSAENLLQLMRAYGVIPSTVIVDIEARFSIREARNQIRGDGIDKETFARYWPDGGEFVEAHVRELGRNYIQLANEEHNPRQFMVELESTFEHFVLPRLVAEGLNRSREGQRPSDIER